MNILIIGAGEVGRHLARLLSRENHDIVVVDNDAAKTAGISESLDVLAIEGQGTSPSILEEAGVNKADMLIAVTTVDEVNILACMIAQQYGVKTKIARVRNREFSSDKTLLDPASLGIDLIIHPELEATREIVRLIRYPQALELITFCGGEIAIFGMKIVEGSSIASKTMKEIDEAQKSLTFRIVAINRDGATIIPRGEDMIKIGDEIYISSPSEHLRELFSLGGYSNWETHHVMIYGASPIGRMVAAELEADKRIKVKLIEQDRSQGQRAAENLDTTSVVIGEASDIDLITREGIIDQDVFAALTDDDENNIVTSLLVRHLKVAKTITLIGKAEYDPIVKTIGLDIAINPRLLTSNAILKFIRHGNIVSLRHMTGISAETYEFHVSESSKLVGKRIWDIDFPKGAIIVAVEHDDGAEIPVGTTPINAEDKVVVFCLPEAVKKVLKLFE